jgi:hypothetical protein
MQPGPVRGKEGGWGRGGEVGMSLFGEALLYSTSSPGLTVRDAHCKGVSSSAPVRAWTSAPFPTSQGTRCGWPFTQAQCSRVQLFRSRVFTLIAPDLTRYVSASTSPSCVARTASWINDFDRSSAMVCPYANPATEARSPLDACPWSPIVREETCNTSFRFREYGAIAEVLRGVRHAG